MVAVSRRSACELPSATVGRGDNRRRQFIPASLSSWVMAAADAGRRKRAAWHAMLAGAAGEVVPVAVMGQWVPAVRRGAGPPFGGGALGGW